MGSLSRFEYIIEHIPGTENVFADILTRWTRGYRKNLLLTRRVRSLVQSASQLPPPVDKVEWPNLEEFRYTQANHTTPGHLKEGRNGLLYEGSHICIPPEAAELKMKILILSHCGSIGHRGIDATESIIREHFRWKRMAGDIRDFVTGCLQCIVTRSGEAISRPLGSTNHGARPNEVVHFDFLYM